MVLSHLTTMIIIVEGIYLSAQKLSVKWKNKTPNERVFVGGTETPISLINWIAEGNSITVDNNNKN